MKRETIQFFKIGKEDGQKFLKLIKEKFKDQDVIDKKYKVVKENDYILFPLVDDVQLLNKLEKHLEYKFEYQIVTQKAIPNPKFGYKSLEKLLINEIPEEILNLIPKSYDIIGEIAIFEFDKFGEYERKALGPFKKKIARAIEIANKHVKTVYEKKSEIKGEHRLRELALIYGQNKSETIHKENKCQFKLDVMYTFFTPRLVFERRRIASTNIKANEIIVDMFAGVGPISIQLAKNNEVTIYSFDINTVAYNYLKENIKLNKLKGKIIPDNIDIKDLINPSNKLGSLLKSNVDRIIMNLPENSLEYIDVACFLMKKNGGIIHNYQFCEKPNQIEKAIEDFKKKLNNYNWQIEKILNAKKVKAYSPKADLVVIDLYINQINNKNERIKSSDL